ncbi:MAG: hypothetical protein H6817_04070 [Phycisphaerales bacterium]|nr:hypothetical protein [Phycisphaerales bacterium]
MNRLAAWVPMSSLFASLSPSARRTCRVPRLTAVRGIGGATDGRWPPLDTVARDVVKTVTGDATYEGHDPVLLLLAWTFDSRSWMAEPLIKIGNAELRGELQLPADQTRFSFAELINHQPLTEKIQALATRDGSRKMDPLESKVSGIHEKLNTLNAAFRGYAINPIPDPQDARGAWLAIAEMNQSSAPQLEPLRQAWAQLKRTFLADDAAAFARASSSVTDALAALPALYRPSPGKIAVELRSNRIQPFRTAWQIMVAGAVLAALAALVRKRALDVVAMVVMVGGFAALCYGLYLRWQIAGRIPAANMFESLLFLSWGMGAFAILSMLVFKDRTVPMTASAMGRSRCSSRTCCRWTVSFAPFRRCCATRSG